MDIRSYSVVTEFQGVCEIEDWTSTTVDNRRDAQELLRAHILAEHKGHIREVTTTMLNAAIPTTSSDGTVTPTTKTVSLPGDIGTLEFTPKP